LVQKHKVVALRGNGTLRADPRVSSSAENVARVLFSFLFTFPLTNTKSRSRDSFARTRRSSKGREGNASSLTGDAT